MLSSPETSRPQISPGTRLNGVYEVDALLSSGGTGDVYKGHEIQNGRAMALKILSPEIAQDKAALARCRKQASCLLKLHTEALVSHYVFSMDPELNQAYLAMEFVEGQSLAQLLQQGPLTFEAVCGLMKRLTGGLQAAHDQGAVHGNLSPANVIVQGGDVGRAKIVGFGLTRPAALDEARTRIGGVSAAEYAYAPPEHFGLFGGELTPKSDIYSLGLVLFAATIGQAPEMGRTPLEAVEKRRRVPDLGGIDLRLRPLLDRMLQPAPADRPASMDEVSKWPLGAVEIVRRRDLDETGGVRAKPPSHAVAEGSSKRVRYALFGGATLAAMALAGVAAYVLLAPDEAAFRPPPSPTLEASNGTAPPASEASLVPGEPSSSGAGALAPAQPGGKTAGAAATQDLGLPQSRPGVASAADGTKAPGASGGSGQLPAFPSLSPSRPSGAAGQGAARPGPDLALQADAAKRPEAAETALLAPSGPDATARPPTGDRITRYINDYDGGDCFLIMPLQVSERAAKIEGYGASVASFQRLDETFKRENGFEADIGLRQVAATQCPAVTFVRGARRGERDVRLRLSSTNVDAGQSLTGAVERAGGERVALLLVSDSGAVHNLTKMLKPAGDERVFNLKMERTKGSGSEPQLLIAIRSGRALESLEGSAPAQAREFFPRLAAEAARTGQQVAADIKLFKLNR